MLAVTDIAGGQEADPLAGEVPIIARYLAGIAFRIRV
jgi:hypothetical protein